MADKTHIEWTDATWNPITGCSVVSPGCTNCYAMKLAGTRLQNHPSRAGLTTNSKAGPVWNGKVRLNREWLTQPLEWKKPRMVFVCAHGDLFHEDVPDEWIDHVFAIIALCPQHTFQILTKRPDRMRTYLSEPLGTQYMARYRVQYIFSSINNEWANECINRARKRFHPPFSFSLINQLWPLPNVWLGVSVEDQARADERIPALLDTPAAIRWVSAEPLLGALNLNSMRGGTQWIGGQRGCGGTHSHGGRAGQIIHGVMHRFDPSVAHHHHDERCAPGLDWVVAGGESGKGARPMHPDWARSLRDQCAAAGIPFFFKQWGNWNQVYDRDVADPDWRRCDVVQRENPHGQWLNLKGGQGFHGERVVFVAPSSKAATGRLLDGVEHNAMPGEVCLG